jgi:hypothetical protein
MGAGFKPDQREKTRNKFPLERCVFALREISLEPRVTQSWLETRNAQRKTHNAHLKPDLPDPHIQNGPNQHGQR